LIRGCHIKSISQGFKIYAKVVSGDSRTAKEIAAYLAEEVMKVFGGHPTEAPTASVTLDNGSHLITQYENDFPIQLGYEEYEWDIMYKFVLDVPVMV